MSKSNLQENYSKMPPKGSENERFDNERTFGSPERNEQGEVEGKEEENPKGIFSSALIELRDAATPQLGTDHKWVRCLWLVIYIVLSLAFIVSLVQMGRKYFQYPTLIEMQIVTKPKLQFPAVTVCNENPVRKSLIGRLKKYGDLLLLDDFEKSFVFSFAAEAFEGFESVDCSEGFHKCADSSECVPPQWICNGVDNCWDGSDESEDIHDCETIQSERAIASNSSGDCIKGYIQCPGETFCAVACDGNAECKLEQGYDESSDIGCKMDPCITYLEATDEPGTFSSANYPNRYNPNENCTWVIEALDEQSRVEVTFEDIEVEGEVGDCVDFLELYDGNHIRSKPIRVNKRKRFCGIDLPDPVSYVSSNKSLTVRFKTDSLLNKNGFKVSFRSVPAKSVSRRASDLTDEHPNFESGFEEKEIDYMKRMKTGPNSSQRGADLTKRKRRNDNSEVQSSDYNSGDYDYDDYDSYDGSDYADHAMDHFYAVEDGDYFSLYKESEVADYSDFRRAAYFQQDVVQANGHQKKDFIVQCTFDGKDCDNSVFHTFQDSLLGNCFSFNSVVHKNSSGPIRESSKIGHEYGLKITLFLDSEEYIGLFAQSTGARIVVHDPKLFPDVKTDGFIVPSGSLTLLGVQMEQTERLGGNYNNCSRTWPEELKFSEEFKKKKPRYSLEECTNYCILNELAIRCNCSDGFDYYYSTDPVINEGSYQYCSITNQEESQCLQDVYSDYRKGKVNCGCSQACVSVQYHLEQSSSPWPSKGYMPYFTSKMLKSTSKRVLSYLSEVILHSENDEYIQNSFRENFARVQVFYQALNFRKISESAAYDFSSLVSDFGGNIGLWLGWSLFVLFDLCIFIFHCCEALANRK